MNGQNKPRMVFICKDGPNSNEMDISAERQAIEHQGRIAGHWIEGLKVSMGLTIWV